MQEIKNRRDSVIVIFAGYPDKIKDFLDRNEGLKSRIAFHLEFPDYNAQELLQIMDIILKERGLEADKAFSECCFALFKNTCIHEDFENGRFVRNLVEQAMMKQAKQLIGSGRKNDISKADVKRLIASDFDVKLADIYRRKRKAAMGFSVN